MQLGTGQIMPDAVAEHIAALNDNGLGMSVKTQPQHLDNFKDPRSVEPLIRALKDSDRSVRISCHSISDRNRRICGSHL